MATNSDPITRRRMLKTAAATAAAFTIVPAAAVRGTHANATLQLGVIGCGGRGNFIADLFHDPPDALTVLKWKEVYEKLEAAVDRCENVANIIESVIIKHT